MGFLVNKITGDGTNQTAITNDVTLEAVVNSLVAHNTTGGALNFSVLIDGTTIFTESVNANGTFRIPDKINLGASSVLAVNAAIGVNVTVSYLQQAIDVAGALSAAQTIVANADTAFQTYLTQADTTFQAYLTQASSDAARAEAALGTTSNPVITGSITEEVYELVGTDINPTNGSIQYKTMTADTTFTENLTEGQSVTLHLTTAGFTATFPTMTWVGEIVPKATDTDVIVLWKVGTTLYGKFVGSVL